MQSVSNQYLNSMHSAEYNPYKGFPINYSGFITTINILEEIVELTIFFWQMVTDVEDSHRNLAVLDTLIIPHKNTLIKIEPHLFLTKTAN